MSSPYNFKKHLRSLTKNCLIFVVILDSKFPQIPKTSASGARTARHFFQDRGKSYEKLQKTYYITHTYKIENSEGFLVFMIASKVMTTFPD